MFPLVGDFSERCYMFSVDIESNHFWMMLLQDTTDGKYEGPKINTWRNSRGMRKWRWQTHGMSWICKRKFIPKKLTKTKGQCSDRRERLMIWHGYWNYLHWEAISCRGWKRKKVKIFIEFFFFNFEWAGETITWMRGKKNGTCCND